MLTNRLARGNGAPKLLYNRYFQEQNAKKNFSTE